MPKRKQKRKKNPAVEEFEYKGHTIKIEVDPDPMSPREWDNLGRILYVRGSRYELGDEGVSVEEMDAIINDVEGFISVPVYAHIHGGIAMRTTPYSDPWDSGQSGIAYVSVKKALKEYGRKRMTGALQKKVLDVLRQEVKTYGEYRNGEVYGYVIETPEGEHVDSLWGIYDFDYARSAAKEAVDHLARKS